MSVTGSAAGFRDFDELLRGTPGYSHRLLKLYNVCTEDKDIRHPIPFEEAVSRLIGGVTSTLRALEIEGNTITEFIIGKSFVKQRSGVRFRPDKHTTWTLQGGINGRWRHYNSMDYNGLVVLACIERDLIPESINQNIRFMYTDEEDDRRKKQEFIVDQQLYTLALEQRLIHHFMLIEPDSRLRNHSTDCGNKSKDQHKGGIIYLAFKMKTTDSTDGKQDDMIHDLDLEEEPVRETRRCEYLVTHNDIPHYVVIPLHQKHEADQLFKKKLGIPKEERIEITLEMKQFNEWAKIDIGDLPESGKLRIKCIKDVKVKAENPDVNVEKLRSDFAQQVQSVFGRSPESEVEKERIKKVANCQKESTCTMPILPNTDPRTADQYLNIKKLKFGTRIRDSMDTGAQLSGSDIALEGLKQKEPQISAPKKSDREKRVILEEMLKHKAVPDKKDYEIIFQKDKNPMVHLSKTLSFILRHGAERKGFKLMPGGYLYVDDFLHLPELQEFTEKDVETVVQNDAKHRFALETEEGTGRLKIRANQGHSVQVEGLELTPILDHSEIPVVVHGTYMQTWNIIKKEGLSRMNRNHIHFAPGEPQDNGVISGMGASCEVMIFLDAEKALNEGLKLYRSANNVILSPGDPDGYIHPRYFSTVIQRVPRDVLEFDPNIHTSPKKIQDPVGTTIPELPVNIDASTRRRRKGKRRGKGGHNENRNVQGIEEIAKNMDDSMTKDDDNQSNKKDTWWLNIHGNLLEALGEDINIKEDMPPDSWDYEEQFEDAKESLSQADSAHSDDNFDKIILM